MSKETGKLAAIKLATELTIILRGDQLRKVIEAGIKAGALGNKIDTTKRARMIPTAVTVVVIVNGHAHGHAKEADVQGLDVAIEKIKTSEPELHCGDYLVVAPCTDYGKAVTERYGNVWRVLGGRSRKGEAEPHTWILTNVAASSAGKLAGTDKKHMLQEEMVADQASPMRQFRIVSITRFPTDFNCREEVRRLKESGITVEALNTVNFNKVDGSKV